VHFSPVALAQPSFGDVEENSWESFIFRHRSARQHGDIKNLLLQVVREVHSKSRHGRDMASLILSQILVLLNRYGDSKALTKRDPQLLKNYTRLEASRKLIEENFAKVFSLQDLADFAGLSVNHYSRLFKKLSGKSPYDYLLHVRTERAKDALIESGGNISQIAEKCGFANLFEFSAAFKKRVGVSPTQFLLGLKEKN
jgi:AraC-like DNA-binding protein